MGVGYFFQEDLSSARKCATATAWCYLPAGTPAQLAAASCHRD